MIKIGYNQAHWVQTNRQKGGDKKKKLNKSTYLVSFHDEKFIK